MQSGIKKKEVAFLWGKFTFIREISTCKGVSLSVPVIEG